ncbi:MAG: ChbG/HpnK family deacetylase [bacterium]|nr:ChbG/HpnK family deacetylase [bacterium]
MVNDNVRKKIIISADDFGRNKKASRNIVVLARLGKLDRVGVMTQGIFSNEEIRELLNSGTALDIHLNATEKVSSSSKTKESVIKRGFLFLFNYFSKKNNVDAARKEWKEQIIIFEKLFAKNPQGINSHHHTHFFPKYFGVILELSAKRSIPFIRFGREGLLEAKNGVAIIINYLRRKDKKLFFGSKFESSDYLVSFDWIKNFDNFLNNLPEGKTELIFHPERDEEFEAIMKYF